MLSDVITLPLRIGVFATRLGLRVVGQAVRFGLKATERLAEAAVPRPPAATGSADGEQPSGSVRVDVASAPATSIDRERTTEATRGPAPTPTKESRSRPVAPAEPAAPLAGTAPEHVSRETQLVETFADPGAEQGVGASVDVLEPWEGYARMTRDDVIARLNDASREELAAVELYEHAHRGRKTVLAAADRQLRRATAADRAKS